MRIGIHLSIYTSYLFFFRCLVDNCGTIFSKYYHTTLRNHFARNHKKLLHTLIPPRTCRVSEAETERKLLEIRKHLVDLVTLCGRPINIVSDRPMQAILKLAEGRGNTAFTREQLVFDIEEIEQQIKKIVIARSYLGVTIQYVLHGRIQNRSIGFVRLTQPHTGLYIAQVLEELLGEYGISINQIYIMTADNAYNNKKALKELQQLLKSRRDAAEENSDTEASQANVSEDEDDEMLFNALLEEAVDDDEDSSEFPSKQNRVHALLDEDIQCSQLPLEDIREQLGINKEIFGVPCVAHTLQSSVLDGLKKFENETGLIDKCKEICVRLRTPKIQNIIEARKLNVPALNNTTRWNSTLHMVGILMLINIYLKICRIFIFVANSFDVLYCFGFG